MITHRAFAVWLRNFTVYKTFYRASLVGNIGEPVLYLFAMGFGIGGYITNIQGLSYIEYIAPGLIITSAMYSATFECTFGSFTRLTQQRTFDSILATPVSLPELVIGEITWGMTKSMISGFIMMIIMTLFGLYTPGFGLPLILLTIMLTGYVFAAAALCYSALSPSYDFFNYYFTLFIAPMFFLSGVFFPIDNFPEAFQWISQLLPATGAVSLLRYFFHGIIASPLLFSLTFMVALAFGLTVASIKLTRRRLIK